MHSTPKEKLAQWHKDGLYRERIPLHYQNGQAYCANGPIANFASNDYLGLSQHPAVIAACQKGAEQYGVGSTASIMVSGYHALHRHLEEALAEYLGMGRVLLFPNGYMANLGAIGGLSTFYAQWVFDRNNHASLYDALRINKIHYKRYQHGNYLHLADILLAEQGASQCIVTEGVFSIDGQLLDIDEICYLAMQYKADLIIDDSHALGVINKRGSLTHIPKEFNRQLVITSSFGKAFGASGGFVASDKDTIENIEQFARSFMYTTALSPVIASAVLASLDILRTGQLQEQLYELLAYFKRLVRETNLPLIESSSAIQSFVLRSAYRGKHYQQELLKKGFLVGLMRPPSVPPEETCLRVTMTARHTKVMIEELVDALCTIHKEEGCDD